MLLRFFYNKSRNSANTRKQWCNSFSFTFCEIVLCIAYDGCEVQDEDWCRDEQRLASGLWEWDVTVKKIMAGLRKGTTGFMLVGFGFVLCFWRTWEDASLSWRPLRADSGLLLFPDISRGCVKIRLFVGARPRFRACFHRWILMISTSFKTYQIPTS